MRARWLALACLLTALAPQMVVAQSSTTPLTARLILKNSPPGAVYDVNSTTPITIVLQIENTSGSPITTTDGFSATEFWRRLFFDLGGNIITNTDEAALHNYSPVSFCFSRAGVLLRPTATAVTPVEVLPSGSPPAGFFLEYTIDDARRFYDLSRPGHYIVDARIPLQTFVTGDPNAIITDCDQFRPRTVVSVDNVSGRQEFTVLSNKLEFFVQSDSIPPTTMASIAPSPTRGWNRSDVTVTLTATDNPGGSGVQSITFALTGAQTGGGVVPGSVATVPVTREGVSSLVYFARDVAGNTEAQHTLTVQIDKTPPELTARCSPSGGTPVVTGRDAGGSGVDTVGKIATSSIARGEFKTQDTFRVQDVAGHRVEAVFADRNDGGSSAFTIVSLTYDGGSSRTVEANSLKCETSGGSGGPNEFNQKLQLPGQGLEVEAKFDAKKNQTAIKVKKSGVEQRTTRPGLVFLLLTTRQGQLGFEQ